MPDRRSPPSRPVPAPIDAHRVASTRGPAASRAPAAAPPRPAVDAPARRPGADVEAVRLERTVDALRRLQATLAEAQRALDQVMAEVTGAVGTAGSAPAGRRTGSAVGTAPEALPAPLRDAVPPGSRHPR